MTTSRPSFRFAVALAGGLASTAGAQALRANEGPGVKLGEGLVAHPGVALESAYDTNVFYADTDEIIEIQSAPFLRVVPHLALATLPPQRGGGDEALQFRLGAKLGIRNYMSDDEAIANQGGLDAAGDLRATINPQGALAFSVFDTFTRTVQQVEASEPQTRDANQGGVELRLKPGGGALLSSVGYTYNFDLFEKEQPGPNPDSRNHRGFVNVTWNFLPKTGLTLDGEGRAYDKAGAEADVREDIALVDSTHARGYLGLTGLLTPRFGMTLRGGWGWADYDIRDDFSSFVGVAHVAWYLRPSGQFRLGYERDFGDSSFSNWHADHYVFASLDYEVARRVILGIKPGVRFREYGGIPPRDLGVSADDVVTYNDAERTDTLGTVDVSADVRLVDWLFFGVAYSLQTNTNDFTTTSNTDTGLFTAKTDSYVKHIALARVEVAY